MNLIDTQILSYYYKGSRASLPKKTSISSVTASEFLLVQSEDPTKANWYPPLPSLCACSASISPLGFFPSHPLFSCGNSIRPLGKNRTDKLILDFNGLFPSVIEYGSIALSKLINKKYLSLPTRSVSHLDWETKKKILSRMQFLCDNDFHCIPLNMNIASAGLNILTHFLSLYEPKLKFRNTVNDILILATAQTTQSVLITNDKLLGNFSSELLGATHSMLDSSELKLNFTKRTKNTITHTDSKGYVNRGWSVSERK